MVVSHSHFDGRSQLCRASKHQRYFSKVLLKFKNKHHLGSKGWLANKRLSKITVTIALKKFSLLVFHCYLQIAWQMVCRFCAKQAYCLHSMCDCASVRLHVMYMSWNKWKRAQHQTCWEELVGCGTIRSSVYDEALGLSRIDFHHDYDSIRIHTYMKTVCSLHLCCNIHGHHWNRGRNPSELLHSTHSTIHRYTMHT